MLLQISVTIISKEQSYVKMNSILSLLENIGVVVGPIVGGYFVFRSNYFGVFAIVILSFFVVLVLSVVIKLRGFIKELPSSASEKQNDKILKEKIENTENFENSKHTLRKIFYPIVIFGFSISIINVIQISFVVSHYNMNELGFGLTESAWGFGMAIGALLLILFNKILRNQTIFALSFLIIGISVLTLVISNNFGLAILMFFLIGVGNIVVSIISTTMIQKLSSSAYLGKNLGIKSMLFQGASIVSMVVTGVFETTISPALLYISAGTIFILTSMLVFSSFKSEIEL